MPKPNKGESKQDFLKRCTSQVMQKENKEADQAYAVCNGMWDDSKKQRGKMTLTAPLTLAPAEEGGAKGFLITAFTGAVIDRWYRPLVIVTAGIKTQNKLPALREHARDRVVGYVTKAWIDGENLLMQGNYSEKTRDGQEVRDLQDEGFPWQASIGVWPRKVKVLESDKESEKVNGREITGPAEIWLESYVREVSFCALGADDETAAISLAVDDQKKVPVSIEWAGPKNQEESIMPITLAKLEAEAPALLQEIQGKAREEVTLEMLLQKQPPAGEQLRAEGETRERARVMEILEAKGDAAVSIQAIKDGTPAAETYKLLLKANQEGKARTLEEMMGAAPPPLGQTPPPQGQADFMGKVAELVAAGEAKTRGEAVRLAARRFPKLHEEYVQSLQKQGK